MTNTFLNILFVGLGGFFGAIIRYISGIYLLNKYSIFVLPTFIVNIIGAFFIGFLYVLISEKLILSDLWKSLLVVGLLGSLTTFSTFSLEIIKYLEWGMFINAIAYIVSSVLTCIIFCYVGIIFSRFLF